MNWRAFALRGSAGLVGAVLLATAMWLHSVKPEVEARTLDPIRANGTAGEETGNREFSLTVERVDAARSLAPSLTSGRPVGTDGVYLVVRVRVMSHRKPLKLRSATLEAPGGLVYHSSPRSGAKDVVPPDFQPMLWTPTAFVFELPKDRLDGTHLVVGTGGLLPQLSAAVDVDLGITGARERALLSTARDRYDVQAERP